MPTPVRMWPRLAELTALWGMAVSQPLLGILGDNTEFFIRNGVRGHSITVFAVALSFVAPVALWGLQVALWRMRRVADAVHLSSVAVLALVIVAQIVKFGGGLEGATYVTATVLGTAAVGVAWWRFRSTRTWVRWLAVVPVAALVLFVVTSPAGRFARAGSGTVDSGLLTEVPLVMIMFDEFPLATLMDGAGRIDDVRFPNFSRLAAMSTWYRMYSTEAEETPYAVPSSLTGLEARSGASATFVDHPQSLFTVLGASHRMRVLESVTQMCPPAACTEAPRVSRDWAGLVSGVWNLFGQRVDTTSANEFQTVAEIPAVAASPTVSPETTIGPSTTVALPGVEVQMTIAQLQKKAFEDWVASVEPSSSPTLDYVHLILPHQPWVFAPDGAFYVNAEPEWSPTETPWETSVGRARHGLQVQMVDRVLGDLLDRMEASGLLDTATVVVTADHGAAFVNGYHRRYATGDYANAVEVMSVPLFVKAPGQRNATVDDANVDNVDLLPIVARAMGFDVPWQTDGAAPPSTDQRPDDTKRLRFLVSPFGAADRPDDQHLVTMRDFASAVLSFGSPGVPGDPLAALYAGTPHDGLRGRLVADLEGRPSSGTVTLDADVASVPGRVLLRGEVSGVSVSSGTWMAVSSRGRVVGLAPVRRNGRFETAVVESDGSPVFGARFHLIESGRLRELTER